MCQCWQEMGVIGGGLGQWIWVFFGGEWGRFLLTAAIWGGDKVFGLWGKDKLHQEWHMPVLEGRFQVISHNLHVNR